MAEHDITGPVIGVSFDGTGYGTDGKIWGGEFLICEGSGFKRNAHLKYITMPGGDLSMKDAWKSAISYVYDYDKGKDNGNDDEITNGNNDSNDEISIDISEIIAESNIRENENWGLVTSAIEQKINTIESSGMGRLFDAVSSLLDICHENRYEGECAILLEDAAARAIKQPGSRKDDLALKFHKQVADAIFEQCVKIREKEDIKKVALTGGVFQNKILMEETLKLLRSEGFDVYYNISVSPNDGGICLGQNYIGMCKRRVIFPHIGT
jgi:hydrogenase maturation protein HypF